jgi:hypothetical protein
MDVYKSIFKELKTKGYNPECDLNVGPIDGIFIFNFEFEEDNLDTTEVQNIVLSKGLIIKETSYKKKGEQVIFSITTSLE